MLKFRAHHFLCTLGFRGKGYSPNFVENYREIQDTLLAPGGEDERIEVTFDADSICEPCPNKRGNSCLDRDKIRGLDERHAKVVGFVDREVLTWREAKKRIASQVTLEKFHQMCEGCGWRDLGYCESALKALKAGAGVLFLGMLLSNGVRAEEVTDSLQPRFVDEIYTQVMAARQGKSKNRSAQIFADGMKALQKNQILQARRAAHVLQKDRDYADLGILLLGKSFLLESQQSIKKKNYTAAVAQSKSAASVFLQIVEKAPDSPWGSELPSQLASAEFLACEAYEKREFWGLALLTCENAFERLEERKQLIRAPLGAAQSYSNACAKKRNRICEAWVKRLIDVFPDGGKERVAIAKHFAGLVVKASNLPRFSRMYETYKAPNRDDERIGEAMELYLKGERGDAEDKLKAFVTEFPKSVHIDRAKYWLGLMRKKDGAQDEANALFLSVQNNSPFGYYAMLASLVSGNGNDQFVDGTLPKAVADDPNLRPAEIRSLRRAEELMAHKVWEYAAIDLNAFAIRRELSSPFLMYLALLNHKLGNHFSAFRMITELMSRSYEGIYSTYVMRMMFPLVFEEKIQKYSDETRIDPLLVLSLIKQESGFRDKAMSWVGASGLMQIMPYTALDTDAEIEQVRLVSVDDNLRLGTKYLSSLLKRFDGNIILALAGYNAGPTRAARWKAAANPAWSAMEFIESIPFKETREYVMVILRNYYWYMYRLNGRKMTSLDYFNGIAGPTEAPRTILKETAIQEASVTPGKSKR